MWAREPLDQVLAGRLGVGSVTKPNATAMVPPGGTDSEWRAMLAFTLDAVAVIS